MTYDPFGSGDFGASPFDEIFARMFGHAAPRRPVQRIDISQLLTEQARELMRDAATQAAQWGDPIWTPITCCGPGPGRSRCAAC